jgi:hypothetical protein
MKYFPASLIFLAVAASMSLSDAQEKVAENPLYPLRVGNKWTYRANDDQTIVVRVAKAEELETGEKDKKTGTPVKAKGVTLEISSGGRTLTEQVAVLPDGVYRFSSAGKKIEPPLCLLKLPPKKGQTWQFMCQVKDTVMKGAFISDEAEVKVPAGTFQAITSATQDYQVGDQKMTLKFWFAPDVGIVQQEVHVGNFDSVLKLEKFEPGR